MSNEKNFHSTLPGAAEQSVKLGQNNLVKAEISKFKNFKEKTPSEKTSIIEFALQVKFGTYHKLIEEIRNCMVVGDEKQANALKMSLPAVSISGLVTEGERKSACDQGRFRHSGFLQGDFDAKDIFPRSANEVRAMLSQDEHVQAVFLSPKDGVKAIIRIPVCNTPAEHKAAFHAAKSYFQEKYGLNLDPSTNDPVRLCFASHDPDAYYKLFPATILPVAAEENAVGKSEKPKGIAPSGYCDANAKHNKLTPEEIRAMLACIPPRPAYHPWLKIASAVWSATGDEATGTELLKEWSPEEETGEYSEKFKVRLSEVSAGTLVYLARKHGYRSPSSEKEDGDIHIPGDVFPVPAGEIEFTVAGEIIFGVIAPKHRVFIRGGSVHEVKDDGDGPAHFAPLSPERFCSLVESFEHRVARREWQEGCGRGKGKYIWRSSRMPVHAAKILLCSDAAVHNLPPVRQLAACPILTKNGKVLARGYDPHAGGTYVTDGDIPPEIPLEAAVTAILRLLEDFNFATDADKSRGVASILSPALKMGDWIDDDFPMDFSEAKESQTGKTYRLKMVCRVYNEVATGITAPRGGVGSLDESISTALIKGRPFIMVDNFRGRLDSTILEQAIRGERRVACRALRVGADVDTKPFNWQMSSNGAELTRDIANRSIITRIRKQEAGYRFKEHAEGDLLAHVAARQTFYLGAVFSIIKEWERNGCPKTDESRHDFRGWCQSLDWIVQHIFKLVPLLDGHREEQVRTANPALQWFRDVTLAVQKSGGFGRALTTAQLVSIAEDAGVEFPGNSVSREEPHQRAGKILGRLFRENEGRPVVIDGMRVVREERSVNVEGRGFEMQKFYTFAKA